ncbi:MFS transporter [Uniformispora flossi]|uniref:MFS transporter n=1 Tax=Uniformispora flossi TaxID=3390723 RepID=UPI003C2DC868
MISRATLFGRTDGGDPTRPAAPGTPPAVRPRALLGALVLAASAYSLLQATVGPAVPTFQREFGAPTGELAWIMNGFILSSAVATPIAGRLGDVFGRKRVLVVVLVLLAAGTAVCALATSLWVMVAGRVVAGLGGAVFPLSFAIVRECLPADRVGPAIGLLSAVVGVGGGIGIVATGPIVEHLSYHWLFWLPLILVGATLAAVVGCVPRSDPPGRSARVDWWGALLLAGTLVSLLLALTKVQTWPPAVVAALLAASVLLGAAWVWLAARIRDPLIDLTMLRLRPVWTANAAAVLAGITASTSMFLLPQLAAQPTDTGFGFGQDVSAAGLLILPQSFTILLAGVVAGRACATRGSRSVLVAGALVSTVGLVALALLHGELWQAYVVSAVIGLGTGLLQTGLADQVVRAVPAAHTAAAAGANMVARNVGMTIGAQQAATVLAGASGDNPTSGGFVLACALAAAAGAVMVAVSLRSPRLRPA